MKNISIYDYSEEPIDSLEIVTKLIDQVMYNKFNGGVYRFVHVKRSEHVKRG